MTERRKRIVIGIPCYQGVPAETLEDYMRFAYHLGRRNTQYDFFTAIKSKSEQFRARNSIVEAALQVGCDYLLMLDDDHVIGWEANNGMSRAGEIIGDTRYDFLAKLVEHIEADPKRGIVGALYYHRGGDCLPVVMKQGNDGGYYYLRDDQITGGLQEVAVQGGGCMLLDMNMFGQIASPWFEPELKYGTDIQISQKAREAGFSVWCDTSIILGHVKSSREVVTPKNRHRIMSETQTRGTADAPQFDPAYTTAAALNLYRLDAEEYLGVGAAEMTLMAARYNEEYISKFDASPDKEAYYRDLGPEQLARQVWYHSLPFVEAQSEIYWNLIRTADDAHGLDFGCGSAPVGFELAMRGHTMDFVDVDGSPAYEFTKWRAAHRGIEKRCGWKLGGPYDYVLMLDSLEHIEDWEGLLTDIISRMKNDAAIITNYFTNDDYLNPEHISMDQSAVRKFLVERGVYPLNQLVWVKHDLGVMDRPREEEAA